MGIPFLTPLRSVPFRSDRLRSGNLRSVQFRSVPLTAPLNMDSLAGASLVNAAGEAISANSLLANKDLILLYFSGHWCPPCRQFTPVLKEFHAKAAIDGKFEVVFVSSDRSMEDMFNYMKESHGPWVAVQHNSALANQLKQKYGVKGIPTLVANNGREDVTSKTPEEALKAWQQ